MPLPDASTSSTLSVAEQSARPRLAHKVVFPTPPASEYTATTGRKSLDSENGASDGLEGSTAASAKSAGSSEPIGSYAGSSCGKVIKALQSAADSMLSISSSEIEGSPLRSAGSEGLD
jgi:hypothetical protein